MNGNEAVASLLVDRGASVQQIDDSGRDAVMAAAERGHAGVVRVLLRKRPDLSRVNEDACSALDHAVANNHPEVVRVLVMEGGAAWEPSADMAAKLGHWRCQRVMEVRAWRV